MNNAARVLVVDDNVTVVSLLRTMLERMGLSVLSEGDGNVALKTARQASPDLILLDMRLPGIDGLEVVRQMRDMPELQATPIVALTGYAGVIRERDAIDAGCNAFFAKPFDLKSLEQTVRQLLDQPR